MNLIKLKTLFLSTVVMILLSSCEYENQTDKCTVMNGVVVNYGRGGSTICEHAETRAILFKIN